MQEIEQKVGETHSADPQKMALAMMGLNHIKEGMGMLAALGHRVKLEWDDLTVSQQFPQMLYHEQEGQKTVHSTEEKDEHLDAGWHDHPRMGAPPEQVAIAQPDVIEAPPAVAPLVVSMPGTTE